MKSVQIRSFFWSKYEEIRSGKNFLFGHFLHNEYASEFILRFCKVIEKLKAYNSTLRDSIKGNFMWEIFQIFYSCNFTDPKPMESDSGKILDMTILLSMYVLFSEHMSQMSIWIHSFIRFSKKIISIVRKTDQKLFHIILQCLTQ